MLLKYLYYYLAINNAATNVNPKLILVIVPAEEPDEDPESEEELL